MDAPQGNAPTNGVAGIATTITAQAPKNTNVKSPSAGELMAALVKERNSQKPDAATKTAPVAGKEPTKAPGDTLEGALARPQKTEVEADKPEGRRRLKSLAML